MSPKAQVHNEIVGAPGQPAEPNRDRKIGGARQFSSQAAIVNKEQHIQSVRSVPGGMDGPGPDGIKLPRRNERQFVMSEVKKQIDARVSASDSKQLDELVR